VIPNNRFTVGTDVHMLPDGDLIISGQYDPSDGPGGLDAGFFLVRLTGEGELVWSRRYAPPGGWDVTGNVKFAVLSDGRFAVVGTQEINNVSDIFLAYVSSGGVLENMVAVGTFFFEAAGISLGRDGELVIVGNSVSDEELIRGMTLKFPPLSSEHVFEDFIGYGFRTDFMGIINRQDNGFYVYGSVGCEDDAIFLSLGNTLRDTTASCVFSQQVGLWESVDYFADDAGEMTTRIDPRFSPPPTAVLSVRNRREFCAKFVLVPADVTNPVCYDQPFRVLDTARQISPDGSIVRMLITLGADAGAGEGLLISNVPNNVTISGNGTSQILLELTGEETGATLTTLLSRVLYVNSENLAQMITRRLAVSVRSSCNRGDAIQAIDFTVAPTNFNFLPPPTDTVICTGQNLALCSPTQADVAYAWNTGDTTNCTVIDQAGTFTLVRSTTCAMDTTMINVSTTDAELLLPELLTEVLCLGDSLVVAPPLPPGVSAVWSDSFPDLRRSLRAEGAFTLQRSNACGAAISTYVIRTTDCCQLYLPTAFSPNGDGVNDRFRAFPDTDRCRLITDYQLTVYNRWGGLVYEGTTPTDGWDGLIAGRAAGPGYYVYALRYFNGLDTVERSGGFTLVR
ncbi:MAG: gliding motility-associated C-terminal domain-containing protein, partial [Bacteroidota bacterium]